MMNRKWWKEAVVYQIYPRSFRDSNGDGVGDIRGIIEKLDYLASLGIDAIWLNPICQSPNDDNGYDISDYRAIMPEMGTMADFDELITGLHERGIKLIFDLVVNHTSDEHEWFKQSRSSRDNPYRDYYFWWDAEKGTPPKRYSFFDEAQNAWCYDELTNSYYLHYFSVKQPDLNWENPKVRQEIYDMMHFWLQKGVDGFRMDAIPYISKDPDFPEIEDQSILGFVEAYAHGPRLHDYLHEMNRKVLSHYDVLTVGEASGFSVEDAHKLVDEDRQELNTFFQFEASVFGLREGTFMYHDHKNRSLLFLKEVFTRWNNIFAEKGWGTVFLGNHDQSRMVSRYGDDTPEFRELSSKMLFTFLFTMRATVYVYFGDEIGMTNIRFKRIEDYQDLQTRNYYKMLQDTGGDLDDFLLGQAEVSRENSRTPMQWHGGDQAGFTDGTPWLKINPNHDAVNVEASENNPDSILHYFRKLARLRKDHLTLVYGQYTLLDAENPDVYTYTREMDHEKFLILLNFGKTPATASVDLDLSDAQLVLHNYAHADTSLQLRPFEAKILSVHRA